MSSNCKPAPAPSDIVSVLKKSSNRLSSLNCLRLSVPRRYLAPLTPRYLSCSNALRAANNFKTGARTRSSRSARMPPCDWLPHAVTMPAVLFRTRRQSTPPLFESMRAREFKLNCNSGQNKCLVSIMVPPQKSGPYLFFLHRSLCTVRVWGSYFKFSPAPPPTGQRSQRSHD